MLNASTPAFNLSNAPLVLPATPFKVLVMNQYLNPAAFLAVGPGNTEENVKTYGGLASAPNVAAAFAAVTALPTYSRNTTDMRLIVNLPETAFNSIDWWGAPDGLVRAGVIPTQTGCVNGVSATGVTDTPGPLGERSNGALTIQLIDPNTPQSALEMNGTDYRSGWRVNAANFMTYVLAEWTVFWHHPNGKCYGQAGWVPNPPLEVESGTPSVPPSGTADPRGPIPPNPTPVP